MSSIDTVLFDLGGVLVDWNPRHLFRKIFDDEDQMEWFLEHVCTPAWNEHQDSGRSIADANAEAIAQHPDHAENIRAYYARFDETLRGTIDGTPDILAAVKASGTRVFALTNWSAETFPIARRRFSFLALFEDILVSGEEGVKKPDPQIFHLTARRFDLQPAATLFIDDSHANIQVARSLGFHTHHFSAASELRRHLTDHRLIAVDPTARTQTRKPIQ